MECMKTDSILREEWVVTDLFHGGVSGIIWNVSRVSSESKQYILKYMPYKRAFREDVTKEDVEKEIDIHIAISKFGMTVPVADYWFCETGGVMIMKKLKQTVSELFNEYKTIGVRLTILGACMGLISKLHRNEYYHGDLHFSNIMVDYDHSVTPKNIKNERSRYEKMGYRYYLIDFGSSGTFPSLRPNAIKHDYLILAEHMSEITDTDESFLPLQQFLWSYYHAF